jgi:ParB family chromosome partitioning protein
MAKRKRLSPPNPVFLEQDSTGSEDLSRGIAPIASVARDASAQAALQEVSQTLKNAQNSGRMIISIPLSSIDLNYLMRDRIDLGADELSELKSSLSTRGQQTPIEVTPLGNNQYGLISGLRRCTALSELAFETKEQQFQEVLALVRRPQQAAEAYLAMVEENEIRVGLSFYERAQVVVKTVETGVYPDLKSALANLFGAASRAKRSKIKSFTIVVSELGEELRYPHGIGERLGLQLSKAISESSQFTQDLRKTLKQAAVTTLEREHSVLTEALHKRELSSLKQTARPEGKPTDATFHSGLHVKVKKNGLSLSGPALTLELQERLMNWLKTELE